MREANLFRRQSHPLRDVPRVDRDSGGVAGGVAISRIQRRHKSSREREIGSLEMPVYLCEVVGESPFSLIKNEGTLSRKRWSQEQWEHPGGHGLIAQRKQCNPRHVDRQSCKRERAHFA